MTRATTETTETKRKSYYGIWDGGELRPAWTGRQPGSTRIQFVTPEERELGLHYWDPSSVAEIVPPGSLTQASVSRCVCDREIVEGASDCGRAQCREEIAYIYS